MVTSTRYHRKVIRIRAADSPNVKAGRQVFPGVLTREEYEYRRKHWDPIRQCIGLDAQFYRGPELMLIPPAWLERSHQLWYDLRQRGRLGRKAEAIGCDPGEGAANTCWSAVDELGLIELDSFRTPDTSDIEGYTIEFGRRHQVPHDKWCLDRGGGGKQVKDRLNKNGFDAMTVAFGEGLVPEPHSYSTPVDERVEAREERYAYKNRRAQMYGKLRELMDPKLNPKGFALPPDDYGPQYAELNRQLGLIPIRYDEEGRMYLPPKQNKDPKSKVETLTKILGCSPDEADSLVVAVYAMTAEEAYMTAGTF